MGHTWEREMYKKPWYENKERDHLRNLGIDGRIKFKWISYKEDGLGLDSFGSG
jgi:hypothetical protein